MKTKNTRMKGICYSFFMLVSLSFSFQGAGQIVLTPYADGYACQGGPDMDRNYGSEEALQTCYSYNKTYQYRTYIRFRLNGQTEPYATARFSIYGKADTVKTVEVYSARGDWTDASLTGSPGQKPSLFTYLGAFVVDTTARYRDIDITGYLNFLNAEGAKDLTIVLVDREHQGSLSRAWFHSKENRSGNPPRLHLETATAGRRPPGTKAATAGRTPGINTAADATPANKALAAFTAQTYYLDAENGNDNNKGNSPAAAWKTLERAGKVFYKGGDRLLFKRGCRFPGALFIKYLPVNEEKFLISAYGKGDLPELDAHGKEICALKLFNTPFVEVKNLAITQSSSTIPVIRRGIYYQGEDAGAIKEVRFDSLSVRNILGNPGKDDGDLLAKSSAGLFTAITGNNTPTYFDGYYLENSYFYRVGRHGAVNQSSWQTRSLTVNTNWTPSRHILIRNNVFEETDSDGLIVRVAVKPVIEHNLFRRCSVKLSGNASFSYNCDSALWQFNEACYTVYNTGDHDAAGFDSDYKSRYTIFQYNYAHHNEYGDMLITGGPASSKGFNDGTIVRYNVFYNNGHHGIRVTGLATNTLIHDNISYNDEHTVSPSEPYVEYPGFRIFYHKNWGGWPQHTVYRNNIFHYTGKAPGILELNEENSKGTIFKGNTVYGKNIREYPPDATLNKEDPQLYFPWLPADK